MDAMRLTGVDIALLAGAGGAVLLVLVWTIATRISTGRRVPAIALRLGADPHEAAGRGMERKLTRLERTAEHAVTLVGEAGVTADRLTRALDAVGEGVVVCDEQGDVVYRNGAGRDLVTPGPAEDAVRELVGQALGGTPTEETVEVPGSPARTLRVAVAPVDDDWRTLGAVAIVEDASERRSVD